MQTIGERLEEARKRKGISIREAAEATKIRGDYLQKFESNQFDLGLAELYVRGFLRSYSLFLKLPAEKIVNDFNALSASGSSSRRAPSREVYGRMDLSVASTDEPETGAAPTAAGASGEAENASGRRVPPSFTRGGGSIQPGPGIDPNLIVKGAIGVIGLVILVLVVVGLKSCVATNPPSQTATTPIPPATSGQRIVKLIALGPVIVSVAPPRADDNDLLGTPIIDHLQMNAGDTRSLPWTGQLLITASARQNLVVEVNGNRAPLPGDPGYGVNRLPAP